jgi:hypothetical protein
MKKMALRLRCEDEARAQVRFGEELVEVRRYSSRVAE